MEINQPASDVSNHGSPDEEQVQSQNQNQQQKQQQARSYECNFCKKGFSNAQALGGHMNIHRKDKAKLKHASKETQRLMNNTSTFTPSRTSNYKPLDIASPSQVKTPKAKWPCIFSSHHHHLHESSFPSPRNGSHVSELKQLPLFVEKAASRTRDNYSNSIIHEDFHSCSHGSFNGADLDLELRLGHQPTKSSVTMGTRKFF